MSFPPWFSCVLFGVCALPLDSLSGYFWVVFSGCALLGYFVYMFVISWVFVVSLWALLWICSGSSGSFLVMCVYFIVISWFFLSGVYPFLGFYCILLGRCVFFFVFLFGCPVGMLCAIFYRSSWLVWYVPLLFPLGLLVHP